MTSHKGRIPWNKGLRYSEETKHKMSLARLGIKLTEETRKKISKSLRGHPVSIETRKKIGLVHKGKFVSNETLKKLSESHKGQHSSPNTEFKKGCTGVRGEKSHFWKGGISSDLDIRVNNPKWIEFRKEIYKRDNWHCLYCGEKLRSGILQHVV